MIVVYHNGKSKGFVTETTGGSALDRLPDGRQKIPVLLEGGQIGIVLFDLLCGPEKEPVLTCPDHSQVVEAVAAGDGVVADGLEGLDRMVLLVFLAELEAGDGPVGGHLQGVAEDGGPAQLFDEGLGELGKGVTEDDDLGEGPQLVQEFPGSGQRLDGADGALDVLQL